MPWLQEQEQRRQQAAPRGRSPLCGQELRRNKQGLVGSKQVASMSLDLPGAAPLCIACAPGITLFIVKPTTGQQFCCWVMSGEELLNAWQLLPAALFIIALKLSFLTHV